MDINVQSILSIQSGVEKSSVKKEVMVVGTDPFPSNLCEISLMAITDTIKAKTTLGSDILCVSEGFINNMAFNKVKHNLLYSYNNRNIYKMVELSDRTFEENPQLKNILIVRGILMILRDLDIYYSNPNDRFNSQYNMVVDRKYFEFILRMYNLFDVFDENAILHISYMTNIIVHKTNIFGDLILNYAESFNQIVSFLQTHFFGLVPPSIQEMIIELNEIKDIGQRLNKYDIFRQKIRDIRNNIFISKIVKNVYDVELDIDFIVVIISSSHYENICKLILESEELVLSDKSFNTSHPKYFLNMGQTLLLNLIDSSSVSI